MTRFIAAAALLVVGCGSAESAEPGWGVVTDTVIGGVESDKTDDGVLVLRTDRVKDTSVCSSSLIAPNLLLTARHCVVAEYPADNIRCASDGTLTMPSGGQLGAPSKPEDVHIFAGQAPEHDGASNLPGGTPVAVATQIVTTDWPSVCRDDVALIVLDRDLSMPIIPLALDQVVTKATRVSVVGYGLTESSNEGDRWSVRQRRDRVPVKYVDTLPNTFAVGRSVCKGDSGGPALDSESGAVVGVYSLGIPGETAADCTSQNALNYYAQVNRYPELLRQGFEAAGQAFPGDAPPLNEGGAGGTPGEEVPTSGGEPNAAGGAGGDSGEALPPMQPTASSASGGCQLGGKGPGGSSALVALLGLLALSRRRTVSC